LNAEKSVGGHVEKSVTSSFFNKSNFPWQLDVDVLVNKSVKFQIKIPNGC